MVTKREFNRIKRENPESPIGQRDWEEEKIRNELYEAIMDAKKKGITHPYIEQYKKQLEEKERLETAKQILGKVKDLKDQKIKRKDDTIEEQNKTIEEQGKIIEEQNQTILELKGFKDRRRADIVEEIHEGRKTRNMLHRDLYSPTNKEYANKIAEIAEKIPHDENVDELGNWTVSITLGGDTYKICNSIEKIDGYEAADYYEFEPWRKNGKYAQYIDQKLGEGFHISAGEEFKDLLKKIGLQTGVDEQQDQYRVLSYLAGGLGALYLVEENGKDYYDCSSYSPESGKIRGFGVDYRESGFGQHLLIKNGEVEKKGGKNSLSKFVEYPGFSEKTGQEQVKIFADLMKSEKLVDVSEAGDFYKISITIPGQGTKNLLITKGEFDTKDKVKDDKNVEIHEKAKNMGFDQMNKADVFRLSERLLQLFDKLGDNEVKTRVEDADGWEQSSSKGNSIWAFFVRFIHDVIHNSVCKGEPDYTYSYLWLEDVGFIREYRSSSNFALVRYRGDSQDEDGIPSGGLSGEDGHFIYIQ